MVCKDANPNGIESRNQVADGAGWSWVESRMRWGKARLQCVSCAMPYNTPCLNFSVWSPDGVWRTQSKWDYKK